MVRPLLFVVAATLAGCTVPAYTCGHPVPCARGSVQSCTSRDGARCRYLLSDGTPVECASCDDCFAAEREIAAWCAVASPVGGNGGSSSGNGGGSNGGSSGGNGGSSGGSGGSSGGSGGASSADLATDEPRDMSVGGVGDAPPDLAAPPPVDLATAGDLSSGPIDTDLGCYGFGYACNADPTCCAHCCAGGCATVGICALY